MKNRTIYIVIVSLCIIAIAAFFIISKGRDSKLVVESIDEKGLFVGNKEKRINGIKGQYEAEVKAIHQSGEYIRSAMSYMEAGEYDQAIIAYKKAYSLDPGSKVYVGLKLIEIYEEQQRYDDALAVLDDLSNLPNISEKGVKKFEEIRRRLLTIK